MWLVSAVISTLALSGDATPDGGDYIVVDFVVPDGTVEFEIAQDDQSQSDILDWGVWSPEGFRGWSGGLTDPITIGVDQSSRGYLPGPITPGTWQLVIGKAKLINPTVPWVATVEFRDAATLVPEARAAFDPVVLDAGPRWYAGDLHVHSRQSGDATATLDEISTLARSRGLDFVAVTDHNTISHHALLAAAQPGLDDFLFVRGVEVTTYRGHGMALAAPAYVDHRVGLEGVSATTIIDDVVGQGGVFTVNHPKLDLGEACIGCAWDHDDTPWDEVSAMEIITGPYEVTGALFTPQVIEMWDALEDQGFAIGAIGGSDDHRAGMGTGQTESEIGSPTTMVLADELSEEAIVGAIGAGRTVVKLRGPDDPMIDLEIDGARVGDTVTGIGRAHVLARVTGGDGATLEIWRDGERVDFVPIDGDDVELRFDYPVTGARERYRAHVVSGSGPVTVTSHIYVEGDPSQADTGCCQTSGRDDASALLVVLGCGAWLRRRRKR